MPQEITAPGQGPAKDFLTELTSGSTYPATFGRGGNAGVNGATNANPRYPTWIQIVGAGAVVVVNEDDSSATLNCSGGEIFEGTFKQVTSMAATRVRLGTGNAPPPSPAPSVADLYTDARSSQGIIHLPPSSFYLATGAPLAVFADGASAVPGSSVTDSEEFCVRWNNNATLNAIVRSFHMPPDVDITQNMTLHLRASKTGATVGDAVTFDIGLFNQVDGALHDADSDFGGTSSAMTGNATAKTVQRVTRTIAAADLAAHPASTTITIKPTNGTLGTDDLCLTDVYITYTKKLLTS